MEKSKVDFGDDHTWGFAYILCYTAIYYWLNYSVFIYARVPDVVVKLLSGISLWSLWCTIAHDIEGVNKLSVRGLCTLTIFCIQAVLSLHALYFDININILFHALVSQYWMYVNQFNLSLNQSAFCVLGASQCPLILPLHLFVVAKPLAEQPEKKGLTDLGNEPRTA